jgi:hypothetical protein
MEGGQNAASPAPLVSILIVNHNAKDLLLEALGNLIEGTHVPYETIVVDNHSKDGSADAVEAEFPAVKVHRMSRNVGFARANNAGLELATGRFVLVLGPDVMLEPGCIDELADFLLVRPDVGAVGPRLIRPDGRAVRAARRGFPTPADTLYRFTGLSRLFPHSKRFGRHDMGHLSPERSHEIDSGSNSCLMFRRLAIDRVGFFDPAYFLYGEDLDLCFRLKREGWKVFYVAGARAVLVSAPATRPTARMRFEYHSAMWTFHQKHFADELPAFGNGLIWAGIWARWALVSGWSAVETQTERRRTSAKASA